MKRLLEFITALKEPLYFSKGHRFLVSLLIICLFLLIAQMFGFNFGLDSLFLLTLFWLLFFIFVAWESKKRWSIIYPFFRKSVLEVKRKFLIKKQQVRDRNIAFLPKRLAYLSDKSMLLTLTGFLMIVSLVWRKVAFLLVFLGIGAEIFFLRFNSDLVVLFLVALWIIFVRPSQFGGKTIIHLGLVLTSLCPFFLFFEEPLIADKMALWAYIFLMIGAVQLLKKNVG